MATYVSRWTYNWLWRCLTLAALSLIACDEQAFFTHFASLGGNTPGSRGTVRISFVNNTPHFAVFTFGLYDPLDETGTPSFGQFFADADNPEQRLERFSTSDVLSLRTGRVLSLGDRDFIEYMRLRSPTVDKTTLAEGIQFLDRLAADPDVQSTLIYGFDRQVLLLGTDFVTGAEITFTFEPDETQPGGVRVDVEIIPPAN